MADDGPTLNAGLVALWFFRVSGQVLLKSIFFCDCSVKGGGWDPDPPVSPSLNPPIVPYPNITVMILMKTTAVVKTFRSLKRNYSVTL